MVPPLGLAYLIAAPPKLGRRVVDLLIALASMIVSAGWWIAAVMFTPVGSRPFIGGSQHNSILELTLGYNGFGRLTGAETGSVGASVWGRTGLTRMFDGVIGGQVAWLMPAALLFTVVGLWMTRRAPRTDSTRASIIVWGGWLVVTALVFSLMKGIFHEYYTVALAPAIAALVGIGAHLVWNHRRSLFARAVGAAAVLVTAFWSSALLARAPGWNAWLRPVITVGAVITAGAMLLGPRVARGKVFAAAAISGVVVSLLGSTAWAVQTAATPHAGSIVIAGPGVLGGRVGFGRVPFPGGNRGGQPGGNRNGLNRNGGFPGGGFPGGGGRPAPGSLPGAGAFGPVPNGAVFGGGFGGAPTGGLLSASRPSTELVQTLLAGSDQYEWVAATIGSDPASGYQLATQKPVMPIGGFNGSDPSPTLAQFEQYVAAGKIHYFIPSGGFGRQNGGSDQAREITSWVEENFSPTQVDGVTLFDLSA